MVFDRPDLFSNRIILDQDWALDAVYTVFHRAKTVPCLRDSGRFTREDLTSIAALGELRYVAPDLLPGLRIPTKPATHSDRSRPPFLRPPTSGRLRVGKGDRLHPGRVAAFTSESLAGFARNTQVRLVREFAHHVDGILAFPQDLLMPRNLDAQLGDGFKGVRNPIRHLRGAAMRQAGQAT